jgi:hypothetical protein
MNLIIEEKDMLNEFKHIQEDIKGYSSGNFWNEIVLNFQWREFYKHELNMWKENKMIKGLPLRSYIYANRMKYIGNPAINPYAKNKGTIKYKVFFSS